MTGIRRGLPPRVRVMSLVAITAALSCGCDRSPADPPQGVTVVRGGSERSAALAAPVPIPTPVQSPIPAPRAEDAAFAPQADLLARIEEDGALRPLPPAARQPRYAATQPHRSAWEAELRGRPPEDPAAATAGQQR